MCRHKFIKEVMALSKNKKPSVMMTAKDMLCEKLDLPLSVVEDLSYMEVLGNSRIVLDGCKGVLDYGESLVRIGLAKGTVQFCGDNLCFKALNNGQAIIEGNIITIEFG